MKKALALAMALALAPLNGCVKLGAGGSGSSTPAGYPGYSGPPPLIGSVAVDLRKGK